MFAHSARPHYADIPFHNFIHAQQTETYARNIAQNLEMNQLDLIAISRAARMHDAGYYKDMSKDFPTKEDYSICLMHQETQKVLGHLPANLKEEIINNTTHGINGTKINWHDFSTEHHKILRAADIRDLGTPDTDSFLQKAAHIYDEYSELHKGELMEKDMFPLAIDVFKEKQAEILLTLLTITEAHIPERPYFFAGYYAQVRKNIEHLQKSDLEKYLNIR